jgi:hypothetical protein
MKVFVRVCWCDFVDRSGWWAKRNDPRTDTKYHEKRSNEPSPALPDGFIQSAKMPNISPGETAAIWLAKKSNNLRSLLQVFKHVLRESQHKRATSVVASKLIEKESLPDL